jgi:ubiquinone/menaquinone biosynthesis C-methylase UbiE
MSGMKMPKSAQNIDYQTVDSFADEWSRYDQSGMSDTELRRMFDEYFDIFPWDLVKDNARGFDMGCGTGRWAMYVAERVNQLTLIDVSERTLAVARQKLAEFDNVEFLRGSANDCPLPDRSQDFGYSLGVLHHIPDTADALASCVRLLKPGAPFLVYLYYRFDNRPAWFVGIWKASELFRMFISRLPTWAKTPLTTSIAALVYWPLARAAGLLESMGLPIKNVPLSSYRRSSFYTMRTDSRDRFGTPLEQRFTREEICEMMRHAGLVDIKVSDHAPYWCVVGVKDTL